MPRKITWEGHEKRQKLLRQNKKRREWERRQQGKNKGFDQTLMVIFGVGFILYMLAVLVIGITWPVIIFTTIVVVGIAWGIVAGIMGGIGS